MTIDLIPDIDLDELFLKIDVSYMTNKIFGISYSQLKSLIYPIPRYKSFTINKRNGSLRFIDEPKKNLKDVQLKLLDYINNQVGQDKPCVHGFSKDRSIVTNASAHCSTQTNFLLNIDIKDFFPSITFYRVRGLFQSHPFGFSYQVATVLAQICTFDGKLPQGAPTSPVISNLICRSLDRDLIILARKNRATYTRYADDISFSFYVREATKLPISICTFDSGKLELGSDLKSLFKLHSFDINPEKSRLITKNQRLEVTGITINEFPNVKRIFIDAIRGGLHAWKVHGYLNAQKFWEEKIEVSKTTSNEKRSWRRQTRSGKPPILVKYLWGKLLFLRMVRGKEDPIYLKLAKAFNQLILLEKEKGSFPHAKLPVDWVVRTAENAEDAVFLLDWTADFKPSEQESSEPIFGQGTAFSYNDKGLITCNHVLEYSETLSGSHSLNGKKLIISSDDPRVLDFELRITNVKSGKSWPGKIVHFDKSRDLAILDFDVADKPRYHCFASRENPIGKGEKGFLMGFPNHTVGKTVNILAENVLNVYKRSLFQRIEITGSGSIRQGNSGGPFLDEEYRLAGIAQSGAKVEDGNDECICYTELDNWIQSL